MKRVIQKAARTTSRLERDESGQAVLEFSLVATMMIVLAFGVIDFSRAIYLRQVLINLSRETANLEARGTGNSTGEIMTNALNATLQSASNSLSLNSPLGLIVLTAVTNYGSGYHISERLSSGSLPGAASRIGSAVNGTATLPTVSSGSFLPANHTVYVAEVFYQFQSITPVGHFFKGVLPTQLYDAAYFSAL